MTSTATTPRSLSALEPAKSETYTRTREAVESHYVFVWRTLRRSGVPEHEADDVAQEVFLLFGKRVATIEPGLERRFLFRAAQQLALRARRSSRRRRALIERAVEWSTDEQDSVDEALRVDALFSLDHLLSRLPEDLRAVVMLCELEEMTMTEAAHIIDVPAGTVASRLRRARELLASYVADEPRSER